MIFISGAAESVSSGDSGRFGNCFIWRIFDAVQRYLNKDTNYTNRNTMSATTDISKILEKRKIKVTTNNNNLKKEKQYITK